MALDDQQIARRFAALTPEARRGFLAKLEAAGLSFAELPIVPAERGGPLPLSYAQRSLWLTWRLDPASPAYNMPGALQLRGVLDVSALEAALQALVERHEVLRTTYPAGDGGEPEQRILDRVAIAVPLTDLRHMPAGARPDEARRLQQAFAQTPFQLDGEPPLRAALWRLADDEHILGLSLHHIAGDGGSIQVLVEELFALYEAACAGRPAPLAPLPIQFADHALWQRNWFEAGERERQLAYWCARLGSEHPPAALPLDRPRGLSPDDREGRHDLRLPAALSDGLRTLARTHNASLFMVMLALLKLTLYRFGGQNDLRVGAPIANRQRTETRGLIGYLTNVQVLRTRLEPTGSFLGLLAAVRETVLDAQAHPDLPFDLLVEALQPERQAGLHPLFQVKCTQQDALPATRSVAGLEVGVEGLSGGHAHFDLSLDFTDRPRGIQAVLAYAAALFDASTVARFAQAFQVLAEQVVARPDGRLAELALPGPLAELHGPRTRFPRADVLELWADAVARAPQGVAVRSEERCFTYAELDAHAGRLAARLIAEGAGPETRVGIHAERSCEFVLGVLAALKAGAAYVPLDPQLPAERLAYQLADSGVRWLLAAREPAWQPAVPVLELGFQAAPGAPVALPGAHPQQAAYVIYTSGSTGQPKGVVVSRGALANYVQAVLARLDLPELAGSMAMVSTVAADLGHTSFFGALCSGRTLHLIDAGRAFDPDRFGRYMSEQRIDVLKIVPSHLQALLQAADPAAVLPRHALVVGGEATHWPLLERVRELQPQCRVLNHYGPTETTVGVLAQPAESARRSAATLPLGRPLANIRALVLDPELNPVPQGVAGELYLGGAGVARSYQGRAAQTAERFVASPFAAGERLYRTGDRVRLLDDGSLEFLGRVDDQVKVRGYRVELREVAQALQACPGIAEAEVVARDGGDGRTQLHGYVVSGDGAPVDVALLREALARTLPDYMVPAAIMQLEALPLTVNGKLDRKALPEPEKAEATRHEAPEGEVEQALAEIWAQVLRVERVGRHDNFFELGGDSILTLQIIARARKRGLRFTPKQLMELQSIAALGAVTTVVESAAPAAAPLQTAAVDEAFALLPVQRWFFEQRFEAPQHWNQSLLLTATEAVDTARLRQAVEQVVAHHDALRLRFDEQQGAWRQRCTAAQGASCFERVDLGGERQAAEAIGRAADAAQRSLSLTQPFKAVWMDLGPGRSGRLLLVAHHLVVDGVSWRVLLEDLQTAYRQLVAGEPLALPAQTTSLAAWSRALGEYARSETLRAELPYWQALAGTPEPDLPGAAGASNRVADARTVETSLDEDFTERLLSEVPQAYRTQINDILLTALARTLCAWDGRDSVLVELEGHGREAPDDSLDLSRTVGWFTSLFPVRLQPGSSDPGASIKAVKEQLRRVPNKGLGYGVLRYLSEEGRLLAEGACPQVTFNYLGQLDQSFAADALWRLARESAGEERAPSARRRSWLEVGALMHRGSLRVRWTYSAAIHDEATVRRLAEGFQRELEALIEHCTSGATGITPADFPLAGASQAQLDRLPVALENLADLYPLSPMQLGMFFHSTYEPGGTAYVNQLRLDIEGLDPARFKAAWQALFDRHEVLRSGFVPGERPLQWVARSLGVPLAMQDWCGRADQAPALDALAQAELERGFDLAAPPLMRLVLVRTAADRHHLVWTRHHLLLDGWSTSRLLAEVLGAYAGQPAPAQTGRFRDYIAWLQARDAAAPEHYWRSLTAGIAEPSRLAAALRQPAGGEGYRLHRQVLDSAETARLAEFARAQRVTVNTLVQAAWALLLQRYTGQDVVCFGATTAGRPVDLPGAEQMLGLFINTLPVVATLQPRQRVGQWLRDLQAQGNASREHEHTPLFEIQRWAGAGGQGLFDSIVVFENYPVDEALRQAGDRQLRFAMRDSREETSYPMTVTVHQGRTLDIEYAFQGQCFSAEQVGQLAGHLHGVLLALAEGPECCLGELGVAGEAERARLRQWGINAQRYPDAEPVHRLIERQVRERPQALALVFDDQQLSYAELNRRANRLAHRLIALGVGPETRVGICVERSVEMIVGLLGILKAGGVYVPLDPEYPQERLAYMREDSGIGLLVTQRHLEGRVPGGEALATLLLDGAESGAEPEHDPQVELHRESLAYVIYTSGSTGRPKGIGISHASLAEHSQIAVGYFGLTPAERMLLFSTINFDGFVEQLFPPLVAGAAVVLRGPELWDSETFHRELLDKRISIADLPTAYWHLLAQDFARQGPRDYGALRQVQATGEAMPPDGVQAWREAGLAHVRLLNTYGPTETVVTATVQDCRRYVAGEETLPGQMPIGQPLAGRHACVLDADLNPAPVGVAGELYLGGDLLARGYHGRPGLSAERFVANPFDAAGGRLYRTGDIARWNAQGQLEYLGRADHQVKVRGFRIELGEIEAQLLARPEVREAVVVALAGPGGARLVGYVAGDAPDAQRLRAGLGEELPEYMVPAAIVVLEALPLNANGKIDRKALPDPGLADDREYAPPQGETEQALARIWAEVLGVERVGRHDNFFERGGHSLAAVQVAARAQGALHAAVTVRDLFQWPVLAELAAHAAATAAGDASVALAEIDAFIDSLESA
ncbi:amino acid adenylation domain-containing protein [Azotobacter chroococcum]|uniref:Amino acid adenylation domain-containing protein n=1 Tax=Azotobacter chroococcum TaxID=353 RepID=A0AA43Z5Z7_9GAMM|nr:non-ribosomal peptide synthetase [Azotobacter chroococcum]NHN76929.1 amino acid adenylation domain-containing protein [Azotobacter chroococcum]